ncbi:DNA-binding helix-turn-helix protein [Clostridiales bacterium oral taxon 876 str. F0540]|nr:DNA-binding helix-turn-helix protein [Clostridiales bacterium oral taxon 876 str. F0540]
MIGGIHMDNYTSFGDIIKREREKRNLSLQGLAELISEGEETSITSSYLSRLESGGKNSNPTIKLACQITKKMGLDFKEVLHSFGYGDLLNRANGFESIDTLIRINSIKVPSEMSGEYIVREKPLTDKEKETLIILIKLLFAFTLSDDSDTIYILRSILEQMDVLKKSRQKTILL